MPLIETGMEMKEHDELCNLIVALSNRIDDQRVELPVPLRNSWYIPSLVIGKSDDNPETEESDNSREEEEVELEEEDEVPTMNLDPVKEVLDNNCIFAARVMYPGRNPMKDPKGFGKIL
ncbi:hypothetical protein OS493_014130 [Desmophyllum pertusum]|uniref:Uncharacterized protein n=1 Tax=Desmophyllum pertusum TaxID=174260 RepID=A0A9X0CZY6_9CNID|nr:hypothetical protein OS493_014130 [Desmophyllum pertusum]